MQQYLSSLTDSDGVDNFSVNPFPGLRPFTTEESHLFFGREEQCDEVLTRLSKHRFVAITGPSGSGKSSFVRCGILPILFGGFVSDYGALWHIIQARPGSDPFQNLTKAILQSDESFHHLEKEEKTVKERIIKTSLESGPLGMIEAINQLNISKDTNFLIIIDQFEELFRHQKNDAETSLYAEEALAYVDLINEAIVYQDLPIFIILTMRSDYVGECAQHPSLTRLINESHYLVPQMTREQKRRAITGPVAVGGGTISSLLIQQLLNDLGNNPDQLPILQHALMRTWDYSKNNGDIFLDIDDYEAIGGMSEALSQHADEAYEELKEDQKYICESIFKSLTEKGSDSVGVRRPTQLHELAAIAGVDEKETTAVVEKFRQSGRSLLMSVGSTNIKSDTVIDISHESLMRIWGRLKKWVEEEAESVEMYLRLAEAAEKHQIGKTGLWRPPDLQLAINWEQKQKPTLVWGQRHHPAYERTMVFLRESIDQYSFEQKAKTEAQKKALNRARVTTLVLGASTIVSIGFLIFAMQQKVEADSQRQMAEIQQHEADHQKELALLSAEEADKRKEEAEKSQMIAEEKVIETETAREEAEQARIEAERSQRIAEIKVMEAEQAREEAELQRQRAEEEKLLAQQARRFAEEQRRIADSRKDAEKNEQQAKKLRFLSIAKSMAVKSLQIAEPERKALIAKQAYIFNETYGGNYFEKDIYEALYNAVKLYEPVYFKNIYAHASAVRSMVLAADGNIYSVGNDGKIIRWKVGTSEIKYQDVVQGTFKAHALATSGNGKWLAAGGDEEYIQIYELNNSYKKVHRINNLKENVRFLAFTANDSSLIFADLSNNLYEWDFLQTKKIAESTSKIDAIVAHPVENIIAYGDRSGQIVLLNENGGKNILFNNMGTGINSLAFCCEGKLLAAGDEEGVIRVWDFEKRELMAELKAHKARVNDLKFSPDNKLLASASFDKTVLIWNVKSLEDQPIALVDQNDWMWSLAFTADSNKLLAGSRDNSVRVWSASAGELNAMVCGHLGRNLNLEEWNQYVGSDIPYQTTCYDLPPDMRAAIQQQIENKENIKMMPISPRYEGFEHQKVIPFQLKKVEKPKVDNSKIE